MSHDTHSTNQTDSKPTVPFRASVWLVVILAGLFVASVNFISVMSHDDGGHGTEHAAPAAHGDGHGHEDAAAPHDAEHHDSETPASEEQHH